jgi:hypothetical protein
MGQVGIRSDGGGEDIPLEMRMNGVLGFAVICG